MEAPTLPGPDFARRRTEAGLQAGLAHKLCATRATVCSNGAGAALGAFILSRPTPHFAFGLGVTQATFEERLRMDTERLALDESTLSAALFGRVFPLATGSFDPHLELAFGGGRFEEVGVWSSENTTAVGIDAVWVVPLLQAAVATDWHVNQFLKFGARFGWTHWLLSPGERCSQVAFGVCTLASSGHFDVENAVWSWQLETTFLFGSAH
jgi:hypothetical protein